MLEGDCVVPAHGLPLQGLGPRIDLYQLRFNRSSLGTAAVKVKVTLLVSRTFGSATCHEAHSAAQLGDGYQTGGFLRSLLVKAAGGLK